MQWTQRGARPLFQLAWLGNHLSHRPGARVQSENSFGDRHRPVKTIARDGPGMNPMYAPFRGKVEASKSVELAFQVPGLLVRLPVKEGQKVAKGEIIAELRQDEFQARPEVRTGPTRSGSGDPQTHSGLGERPEERLRREAQVAGGRGEAGERQDGIRSLRKARQDQCRLALGIRAGGNRLPRRPGGAQGGRYSCSRRVRRRPQGRHRGPGGRRFARSRDGWPKRISKSGMARCALHSTASWRNGSLRRDQTITANKPVVTFQNVDEIDVVADVPEAAIAADVAQPAVTQMVAEFSTAPGRQFPVRVKEVAQVADPTTQTFQVRVAMKAPSRRHGVAGNDGHGHGDVPAARNTRADASWCRSPRFTSRPPATRSRG